MGCGGSKATKTIRSSNLRNRPASAPTDQPLASGSNSTSKQSKPSSAASKKRRPESGGVVSVSAIGAFRGGSADSNHSIDSGIGAEPRDGSETVARITLPAPGPRFAQQLPADLNALKSGARPRPRIDEESILASLRQEGLLGVPNASTTKGGLCFEVSAEELKVRSRRPPPRLQRLEPLPNTSVTKDLIRQKLATAETRRKKRANDKIQRNREKDAKHLEVKLASLDMEHTEVQQPQNGRIISAKNRRRPPPAVAVPAASPEDSGIMAPKDSPLVIDEIPVGPATKQRFF